MDRSSLLSLKVKRVSGGPDLHLPPLSATTSISTLKVEIEKLVPDESCPPVAQRLIWKGTIVKDEDTLDSLKVNDGGCLILQVVKKILAEHQAAAAAAVSCVVAQTSVDNAPAAAAEHELEDMYSAPSADDDLAAAAAAPPAEMVSAMDALVGGNTVDAARMGLTTLLKVIDNVLNHPEDAKYRSLKQENAVFKRKLGGLTGGRACLLAAGFTDDGAGCFTLEATAEAWEHLNACRCAAAEKLESLPHRVPAATVPAATPAFPAGGLFPFGGGGGMPAGGAAAPMPGFPDASVLGALASNPALLQQMMSSPFAQQMMASNPAMASQMQAMLANPQMLQQMLSNPMMQQMMRDPNMMQQAMQMSGGMGGMPGGIPDMNSPMMQAMMRDPNMMQQALQMAGGMGGMGGMGAPSMGTSGSPPVPATPGGAPQATSPPQASRQPPPEAKTEEELIAEAIARSLEDK